MWKKYQKASKTIAFTEHTPVAAMCSEERKLYGVQFHPEVQHTPFGQKMIQNFLFKICGLKGDWDYEFFCSDENRRNQKNRRRQKSFYAL